MRFPGFIGPSYTLSSVQYDCQRCINLYPEMDETGNGKEREVMMLVGTPGTSTLASLGNGPIRGMWFASDGSFWVVSGGTLYSVSSSWVATSIGSLKTTTGSVSMCDNGFQLAIVDGTYGYYVTLGTTTLNNITDSGFKGADVVTFQDGYFIFNYPNKNKFYISDLNAITFGSSVISSKSGHPDNIVSVVSVNRNLWLLGDQTSEVWFDSGDNTNPFQYTAGTLMQYGCAAKFGVAVLANALFWIGKSDRGTAQVFLAQGYQAQRISTSAVEKAFQNYSTISDAIAWGYQESGHNFFVLTFPTANATWCYDLSTNLWHERFYNNNGVLNRLKANCYAYAFGVHVVGDNTIGQIYQQSLNFTDDAGVAIIRRRVSPHISSDMKRILYPKFQLDFETGVGTDGTNQGNNPQAVLRWSNDGGQSWSSEMWTDMGKIGQFRQRAIWRKLGQSRNRVFEVSVYDPVKVNIIGAEIDVEVCAS